jgi:hypothetical protein
VTRPPATTRRKLIAAALAAVAVVGAGGVPAQAHGHPHPAAVRVTGAVTTPASYTAAQLSALTPTTVAGRHGSVTGVALGDLVTAAVPVLPTGKNTQLRVTVTVSGSGGRSVAFALGELDPSFGNHPALLVAGRHDTGLVVPADRNRSRSIDDIRLVSISVTNASTPTGVAPGSLLVTSGRRQAAVSARTLARLPQHLLTVTFLAGTAAQAHTERGPTLAAVLRAARMPTGATTTVAGVGDDGYVAAVSPAEASVGGRPLLVSTVEDGVALAEPRLVPAGDVKGGRYVSGLLELLVSRSGC